MLGGELSVLLEARRYKVLTELRAHNVTMYLDIISKIKFLNDEIEQAESNLIEAAAKINE